jgi:hypothetical protein
MASFSLHQETELVKFYAETEFMFMWQDKY